MVGKSLVGTQRSCDIHIFAFVAGQEKDGPSQEGPTEVTPPEQSQGSQVVEGHE